MIADGPVPKRQRKFSISISDVEGSEGASVDTNRDTATIVIATNFDDCKIYLNYQSPRCACVSHTGIEFRFAQPFIEVTESQDAVAHVCVEAVSPSLSINVTVHLNSIPLGESKLKLYKNDCCVHRISLQKDSATVGEDFGNLDTAVIPFGQTLLINCYDIPIVDDDALEDEEMFTLTLTQEYAFCHHNQAISELTVTILEDPSECKFIYGMHHFKIINTFL